MKIKKTAIVYMKHGTKEHLSCIKYVKSELKKRNILFGFYARENLSFSKLSGKDLIVVVGGDGTFLKASHFIEGNQITFGINSDPDNKEGFFLRTFKKDFVKKLEMILKGKAKISRLARLESKIGNTKIPLSLNEIFVGDAKPYRMSYYFVKTGNQKEWQRSSGILISTPAGTYAWASSAACTKLPLLSNKFEIVTREPYVRRLVRKKSECKVLGKKDSVEIISDMDHAIAVVDSISKTYKMKYGQKISIKLSDKSLNVVF